MNVAADPLFSFAYTGANGGFVVVTADEPGIHSSQTEQDNRFYAGMINVAGSDIALFMGIPIYLNSIGTVICAVRYGPSAGMIAGAAGALICGVTTDIYSLYYLPVQIIAGGAAGLIFRKYRPGEGNSIRRIIISAAAIAIPVSLVSAVITAFVFGGVTSSESSVLVQILHNAAGM